MKKLFNLLVVMLLAISLVACSSTAPKTDPTPTPTSTPEVSGTVVVNVLDGTGTPIDVEFPVSPQKVACLNYQTVDFLDAMGLGHTIAGMIKEGSVPAHLQSYVDNENIVNLGGMKDIDMEALMELEPEVIFSSDRTRKAYDKFSAIAPTMSAAVVYGTDFMEGYTNLANQHAKIFGIEGQVEEKIAGYNDRIAKIAEVANGSTALIGIFAGGINTLGNEGRCNILTTNMGFKNLQTENVNHGNISSYEAWLEINPDYMFVLDKDTAVGTEAVAAEEQMDNEVIKQTNAYKNGKIIYLTPGDVWYMADGGITSLDLMLTNVETGLGIK